MKTAQHTGIVKPMDEYTSFYNWSERTAVFFRTKKQRTGVRIADTIGDLLCLAAMAIAMIQSF